MSCIQDLTREGPDRIALDCSSRLMKVRHKHLTWITDDIANLLIPFEQAFKDIGASQIHLDSLPIGPERIKVIEELHETFKM
jgi:hypothetical protein